MEDELKPGEITLEYTADVHILEAITHLKNDGLIFPKKTIHAWGFLNTQPFIPDMLLCYEKIVLPRIYWYDLEHETLVSELDDLVNEKILRIPPDRLFNPIECMRLEQDFSNNFMHDPRYIAITYLANPRTFEAQLKELGVNVPKRFGNPWLGGAGDIADWLESVDTKRLFEKVKSKSYQRSFSGSSMCQSIVSKSPVVAEGYLGPVNLIYASFMGETSRRGYSLLLEALKIRGEIETDAYYILFDEIEKAENRVVGSLSTPIQTITFPLSLPLILHDIEDGKGPRQFYDRMLDLRKEYKPLREWLTKFDTAIKEGKIKERIKYEKELRMVINKFIESKEIRKEHIVNQNIAHYSELAGTAAQAVLTGGGAPMSDAALVSKLASSNLSQKVLEKVWTPIDYKWHPHRLHLKDLAEFTLVSWKELRNELIRCFPEGGEEFAQTLRYYSKVSKICREILTTG